MVCPNCYEFLKGRLEARVVSIYEKLTELGLGDRITGGSFVFMPCPDRESGELLSQIECGFAENKYECIETVQCCGLGGNAGVLESELAQNMASGLKDKGTVCVYCASCAGKLKRDGVRDVRHILAEILGTHEDPDTGKSMINRIFTKMK
jgi:Fe-S oxidoreductase